MISDMLKSYMFENNNSFKACRICGEMWGIVTRKINGEETIVYCGPYPKKHRVEGDIIYRTRQEYLEWTGRAIASRHDITCILSDIHSVREKPKSLLP